MILAKRYGCLALVLSTLCVLPPGVPAAEPRRAVFSSEELRKRLGESQQRVGAWYFEYQSLPDLRQDVPPGGHVHCCVAARFPDHFFHWASHGTASLLWQEDPLQQRLVVTSTESVWQFPLSRIYQVTPLAPDAPLPGSAQGEFIFAALGWWPFDKRPASKLEGGQPYVLPEVAQSPHYVVRPWQVPCEGTWCHVLECPGRDKLWLDCDRNCALLARETFDANTGVLRQRLELRNHREIQPGIWVPLTIRNIQFEADPPTAEGRPRKSRDALFRVLDVRLNDQVGPEMFEFTPRPGAVRMFEEGRYVQASPGGWDHLDFLVHWMRRNVQFSISSRQLSTHSRRAIWDYAVIFAATLVILVFSRRRRQSRRLAGDRGQCR